ncbi:DUF6371 domain-containing protein [Flavobacterium covae]|uniref:DUF6371 domain-containing protein n=1 Tax=Flavobacterium covae TaxID=2906076 RepID=UPI000745D962|nr:DUF6371 domain-containing protein [Flavobacterium covae]AMA48662.1 hypothetical protein AWN65_03900 [Flavobacterium covae]MCJ1809409.1 DUF6371 domain-containing protein [Flavobacterium covae]
MNDFQYTLEPYNGMKTRFQCPNCNKKGIFTKYIDNTTNEYLNDKVGKCNRTIKCGYHYTPKQYFNDNDFSNNGKVTARIKQRVYNENNHKVTTRAKTKIETSFIPKDVFNKSLQTEHTNCFIDYLANIWDYEIAYYLAEKYNIGTSKHWNGATVFWQVDKTGNVRSGKIMLYNPITGKRVKEPYNHINWVHTVLKLENFNLEQCYFGEHLLNEDKSKPVAIVESEKTAIISSVFLPDFIWISCGSVNNLNYTKTSFLKGRNVVLFPDLSCYELWNSKIATLTKLATFRTSTLLETKATEEEKKQGLDIADYLIQINNNYKL